MVKPGRCKLQIVYPRSAPWEVRKWARSLQVKLSVSPWKHPLIGVQSWRQGMGRRRNEASTKGTEAHLVQARPVCMVSISQHPMYERLIPSRMRLPGGAVEIRWVAVNKQLVWMPPWEGTIEFSRKTHNLTTHNHGRTSPLPYATGEKQVSDPAHIQGGLTKGVRHRRWGPLGAMTVLAATLVFLTKEEWGKKTLQ